MVYVKTTYGNDNPPSLKAANMNKIEDGIAYAHDGANIKTMYEAEADTNAFTDADHTKLDGIEALADVTDATNVDAAGATMNADADVSGNSWAVDEDDMVSDLDTKVPTQQSVKAYVDTATPIAGTGMTKTGSTLNVIGGTGITANANDIEHDAHTGDVTGATGLTIGADKVLDSHINWGTGATEVSAVDVPIADTGAKITATEVEGALQENRTAIDLNTAKTTNATHTGEVTGATALTIAADAVTYAKIQNVVADDRILGNVTAADSIVEELTAAQVLTMISVTSGADVTADNNPKSHGAAYHTDRTRKFLVSVPIFTTGALYKEGVSLDKDVDEYANYIFKLPEDFVSIVGCKIIMHRLAVGSGNVVIDLSLRAGEIGENCDAESNNDLANTIAIPDGAQVAFASDHATLFTGVTKNHYISFTVTRDANDGNDTLGVDLEVTGVEIEYTADM